MQREEIQVERALVRMPLLNHPHATDNSSRVLHPRQEVREAFSFKRYILVARAYLDPAQHAQQAQQQQQHKKGKKQRQQQQQVRGCPCGVLPRTDPPLRFNHPPVGLPELARRLPIAATLISQSSLHQCTSPRLVPCCPASLPPLPRLTPSAFMPSTHPKVPTPGPATPHMQAAVPSPALVHATPEAECFHAHAAWSFTFPAPNRLVSKGDPVPHRLVMGVEASQVR